VAQFDSADKKQLSIVFWRGSTAGALQIENLIETGCGAV